MNILTDKLPTKILVRDRIFKIDSDYRTVITILQAFEDINLTHEEKLLILVNNLYAEEIPAEYFVDACKQAVKFIDLGKEQTDEPPISSKRIYSFNKDANYIFSGISQTHHIDLSEKPNLHWWAFLSFFMDMSPDCTFAELVYYRKRKNENKLTKEEKERYKKIKKLVDLDEKDKESIEARRDFLEQYRKNHRK